VKFLFVSTCEEVWGGSEELWSGAAMKLARQGHRVLVFKSALPREHTKVQALLKAGCRLRTSTLSLVPMFCTFLKRVFRWNLQAANAFVYHLEQEFHRFRPNLVVISQGQNFDGALPGAACQRQGIPYVLISHKASEWWPSDDLVQAGVPAYHGARRVFFVSERNLRLTESQLGSSLRNAVVVRNPVPACCSLMPWPQSEPVKIACVARLLAFEKGQDLLFEVFAKPRWRSRAVEVSLFGSGPNLVAFERRVRQLALNLKLYGFVQNILNVWRTHHLLVLPSRAEGIPIAAVEAMLCGRPCLVTDVGGNSELVDSEKIGYLAEAPTVERLDEALEQAWQTRDRWPTMGVAARQRALAFVGPDPVGEFTLQLLAEGPDQHGC